MRFGSFSFGSIAIDGKVYYHDVVIDRGKIRKRDKQPSKPLEASFGHTPLSAKEAIPWECTRLVIGTGFYGRLPIAEEVVVEAKRRGVRLVAKPTAEVLADLDGDSSDTNAILHVTC
jgi:hypothetical protein